MSQHITTYYKHRTIAGFYGRVQQIEKQVVWGIWHNSGRPDNDWSIGWNWDTPFRSLPGANNNWTNNNWVEVSQLEVLVVLGRKAVE